MPSRPPFRLGVAGGDDGIPSAHPAQGGGCLQAKFPSLGGDQIGNFMRLEMPPHIFHGIEFGSIGRQPFDHDATFGGSHMIFDEQAAMNGRTIPEDQHFSGDVPLALFQEFNHLKAFDAAGMDLKEKSPQGQAADARKAFPVERLLEHRSLSAWSPGARPGWPGAQPAFVNKDNGSALPTRLFFKAGQTSRFQRPIALSSRSTARRSGRWQLNPLAPSNRHTCPG